MTRVDPKTPYTKDYLDTLKSPAWAALKRKKIKTHDHVCERCGEWSDTLELHHKHYRCIGKEKESDVLLLCPACHREADNERIHKRWKQKVKSIMTFGNKKYGAGWQNYIPFRRVAEEFDKWLKRKKRRR
jgi:hypothetical protein